MQTIRKLALLPVIFALPDFNFAIAASVAAEASLNPAGDNNAVDWTAATAGATGNLLRVAYADPGVEDATLSVASAYSNGITTITFSLATDENGDITSTAQDLIDLAGDTPAIDALITGANAAANDGTGVVTAIAATALTGGRDASTPVTIPARDIPDGAWLGRVFGVAKTVDTIPDPAELKISAVPATGSAIELFSTDAVPAASAAGDTFDVSAEANFSNHLIPAGHSLKVELLTGSAGVSDFRDLYIEILTIA